MREIKFRIFKDGEMSELDYLQLPHKEESIKLMQFTGLKDKNGIEIYEGDLLKGENSLVISVVSWDNYYLCWETISASDGYDNDLYGVVKSEVIGNIYENPELFQEETK